MRKYCCPDILPTFRSRHDVEDCGHDTHWRPLLKSVMGGSLHVSCSASCKIVLSAHETRLSQRPKAISASSRLPLHVTVTSGIANT